MKLPEPGATFESDFVLHEVIGAGGFAVVYRATDRAVGGRQVAIKILTPEDPRRGYAPDIAARFDREVRIVSRLRDPHTVVLYRHGRTAEGLLYLVFEYVPGRDLSETLADVGRLAPEIVERILRQVLYALREAHSFGLLHRDIKPQNIRVFEHMGDPWRIKLLDFGIAKPAWGEQQARITRTGEMIGTPRYMSPEQLTERELAPTADLYSLGVVGFEMLAGDLMHGATWSDQLDRLRSGHLFGVEELDRIGPLHAVIEKMCARYPRDRYQSADDVLRALDASHTAPAARAPMPAPRPRPTSDESHHLVPATKPSFRPAMWQILAAGVGLAAVGILGAYVLTDADDDQAPTARAAVRSNSLVKSADPIPPPPARIIDDIDVDVESAPSERSSPGCGRPPPRGTRMTGLFDGLQGATWAVHLPRNYDPDRPYPIVVLFHQDFGTGDSIIGQTGIGDVADEHGFVVIAPDGSKHMGRSWRTAADVAFVPDMLRHTAQELCIDPGRVFAVGHNVGGLAANRLSCMPWVTAIATHGFRPREAEFACDPPPAIPHFHFVPLHSRWFPREGGKSCEVGFTKISLADWEQMWRTRNACGDERTEAYREGEHVCWSWTCEQPFQSCHLDGAGRSWPGSGFEELDPTDCDRAMIMDFQATEVMWTFFASIEPNSDASTHLW